MSEWYYSDAQRQQHGPVGAADMAALHAQGALTPETLVWRDGMANWRPWRDVMGEVLGQTDAGAPTAAAETSANPFAADPFAANPTEAKDDGAYRPYEMAPAPSSPYAPPKAALEEAPWRDDIVYAGFLKRFAANVIDSLILCCGMGAVLVPLAMLSGIGTSMMSNPESPNPMALGASVGMQLLFNLAAALLPCFYFGWMQSSERQASLGKQAVGIKVVRSDGSRLSFGRAFLRQLAFNGLGLVTCNLTHLISAIMSGVTERKQGLHDMMADSLVVDEYAFTSEHHLQRRELGTVAVAVLIVFGVLLLVVAILYGTMFAAILSGLGQH